LIDPAGRTGSARCAIVSLIALVSFLALGAMGTAQSTGDRTVHLVGAGATFPAPLYRAWIGAFTARNPDVAVEYLAVGSGEGIRRFLAASVDFAASDGALTDEQLGAVAAGARLVPATAGLVVLAYNVPGLPGVLRLSRDVYADIFAGRIVKWNDPRLRSVNPDLALPSLNIAVVARQDSSGTTFALTNHLSAINPRWRDRGPGVGYVVDWSNRAMLARGNEGVAARVKMSEGAIGYMEYGFARRLGLPTAELENKAGRYVAATERSGQVALAVNARQMPANLRLFLPDPEGVDAYPIVSFSWLLLYDHYQDPQKSATLKRFVAWGLDDGQAYAHELGYIPLPPEVAALSRAAVEHVR